jgi:hypothetical protein
MCSCRGLYELNEYSALAVSRKSYGLAVGDLSDPQNGMKTVWLILGVEWVIFMLAAGYLEQVGRPSACVVSQLYGGQDWTCMCMWWMQC